MLKLFLSLPVLAVVATGCGASKSKSDDVNNSEVQETFRSKLIGTWSDPCTKETSQSMTYGMRASQVFHDRTNTSFVVTAYSDTNCQKTELFAVTLTGTFEVKDKALALADAHIVEVKYTKTTLVPKNFVLVASFNDKKICGFSDWKEGEQREIKTSMSNCEIAEVKSEMGEKASGYFAVSGNTLNIHSSETDKSPHSYTKN